MEFYFQLILIQKFFFVSRTFARVSIFFFFFSVNFRKSSFVIYLFLFFNNFPDKSENPMSFFISRISQLGKCDSSVFFSARNFNGIFIGHLLYYSNIYKICLSLFFSKIKFQILMHIRNFTIIFIEIICVVVPI